MPLTKAQIIEIQEAARFNTLELMEKSKKQKELKKRVAEAQQKALSEKPQEVEKVTTSVKKGK